MSKLPLIIFIVWPLIFCSCDSTSKTTQVNPHAAAHSQVHQDFINKEEQKIKDASKANVSSDETSDMTKFNAQLEGAWNIIQINGITIHPENFKYDLPNIDFFTSKEMAVGHDGCNQFNVHIEILDETIVFGQIMSTLMACKDHNEITNNIREALSDRTLSYKIVNNQVTLLDADMILMTLSRPK